jgi:hypothetical protein
MIIYGNPDSEALVELAGQTEDAAERLRCAAQVIDDTGNRAGAAVVQEVLRFLLALAEAIRDDAKTFSHKIKIDPVLHRGVRTIASRQPKADEGTIEWNCEAIVGVAVAHFIAELGDSSIEPVLKEYFELVDSLDDLQEKHNGRCVATS